MPSTVVEIESVVARLRPHGRRLFWPSFFLIATIGAVAFLFGRFEQQWQNTLLLAGGALFVVLVWLIPLLAWLGHRYIITTRRLVLRRGFFVRTRQELLHSRGYDVTVRKNALQSMFGSGDVRINTGLDRPVVLRDVPGADLVQSALHDLMERSINPIAARRQAEESADTDETTAWGGRG